MSSQPPAKPRAPARRRRPVRAPLTWFLGALALLGAYVFVSGRASLAVSLATVTPRAGRATQAAVFSPLPRPSGAPDLGGQPTATAVVAPVTPTGPPSPTRNATKTPSGPSVPSPTAAPPTLAPGATPIGGGSGIIAFTSDRDGNPEIYRMALDGTGLTRLTYTETED